MSTRVLGSWEIGDKLGEGSAGEVYRATRGDGVPAALKLYRNRDPGFVTRSLAALQQLARVHHPNLVQVLGAGVVGAGGAAPVPGLVEAGTLYLASRLVDGRTLETRLEQRGPLSRAEAVTLVGAVAAALDALHRAGMVHRDVKPTNVLVPLADGPAGAVLIDLGLVGVVDQSTRQTRSGEVFGTPAYMSPEQALGRPQSAASDVWALAALYHRLLLGRAPFEREGVLQTLAAVATETWQLPDGAVLAAGDRAALERALDPDPARRFPTALAFAQALRDPVPRAAFPAGAALPGAIAAPSPTAGAAAPAPPAVAPSPAPRPTPTGSFAIPRSAAASTGLPRGLMIGALAALALAVSVVITSPGAPNWMLAVLIGLAAATGAWLLLSRLAARAQRRRQGLSGRLHGARRPGRRQLTDSLAISMDELLEANRHDPHLKIMGASIRLVIGEYEKARDRDDRHQALDQIIKLIELVDQRAARTSWLERHQKLLAVATGALALVGTGATQIGGVIHGPVRIDTCPDRPLAGGQRWMFSSLLRGDPGLADRVVWSVDGEEKNRGGTFTFAIPQPPGRDFYVIKLTAPGVGSASCVVRSVK